MQKTCKKCNKLKDEHNFHGGYSCKECHSDKVQFNKKLGVEREIKKLLKLNIIKKEEVDAAKTLYVSAKSRIESCKYKIGIYGKKGIKSAYDSPFVFTKDIIETLPTFWGEWKNQNKIYEESRTRAARPTIDRIDDSKGYTLSNIQMLSKRNNTLKAASVPNKVIIIKNQEVYDFIEFESKKEMNQKLIEQDIPIKTTKIKMDTGKIQEVGNGYSLILQSEGSEIKSTNKACYKVVIDRRREKYDLDTGEVVEVLESWQNQFKIGPIRITSNEI
ncbi:hypothetical protein [Domibacillus tundrae]|uniref:hypothetical protein n=1 Tax=Domibacillus tundrae TaxID=1587527 RepID=UPI000617E357|nr:hypothetical protein [Domibacillus tundrae]